MLTAELSKLLDDTIRPGNPVAESALEKCLRSGKYRQSPTMLAVALLLLIETLARYWQWEKTNYGGWLYRIADNPHVDLTPPIIIHGLTRKFGSWWNRSWRELAHFIVSRYVVRRHQLMADIRKDSGERCLLQTNDSRISATGQYERVGISNLRFRSAVQVLIDLGLMERISSEDEGTRVLLTGEGTDFLNAELTGEVLE